MTAQKKPAKPRRPAKPKKPKKSEAPKAEQAETPKSATRTLDGREITQVERMASQGLDLDTIAAILGTSERTLRRRLSDQPEAVAAYKKGRSRGEALATQKLHAQIKRGNIAAIIFFLKTRCGWRETKAEPTTAAAQTPQDYAKAVREAQSQAAQLHKPAEGDS